MSFPTPYTVQWIRFTGTETDELGNLIGSWADPIPRSVIGSRNVAVETSSGDGHAAQEKTDIILYVPPGFNPATRDRIGLGDKLFEVIGSNDAIGFHRWLPGRQIKLRRVEG
jgi:hypothetical protein